MKTNLYLPLLFLSINAVFYNIVKVTAQPVIGQQRSVGANQHDNFTCMALTNDSGFIAGGSSDSPISGNKTQASRGTYDYWIVKFDKLGKIQWDKTIGGNKSDLLQCVLQTTDGGYMLAGSSLSTISGEKSENPKSLNMQDIWVVKLNSKGEIEWDKTMGGDRSDFVASIKQTKDGNYIIGGRSNSNVSGDKTEPNRGLSSTMDYWVIKLNADKTIAWEKTLGGKNDDQCNDIIETKDGSFLAGGLSNSGISGDKTAKNKGYYDMWVIKLSNNGTKLWDKTYGGSSYETLNSALQTQDGGFILTGTSDSNISGDKTEDSKGLDDFWFVKTDASGVIMFDKTIGGSANDNAYSIQQTRDENYIVAGTSTSGISRDKTEVNRGDVDFWIVKINKEFNLLWDKTIGGNAWDDFVTIKERRSNQYYIGGFSQSPISGDKTVPATEADYWLVELKDKKTISIADNAVADKLNNKSEPFIVYPNPAQKILYIQSSQQNTFTLTDQSGRIMFTKQVSGAVCINIANLLPGTYYLNNKTSGVTKNIIITK